MFWFSLLMVEVNLWISCYQIPPFFIFELQSKWIAGVLSNRFALPSQDEMMEDVKAMYSLLEASGTPKRYTHNIADHHVSAVSLLLLFLVNGKFSLFGFLPMFLITFNSYICTYQEGRLFIISCWDNCMPSKQLILILLCQILFHIYDSTGSTWDK